MSLDDYVNQFGEQGDQEEKKIDVVRNPRVEEICRLYQLYFSQITEMYSHFQERYKEAYNLAYSKLNKITPTPQDITNFSLQLKDYENSLRFSEFTGIFLSALVDDSPDDTFEIFTEHLDTLLDGMGYKNKKNVKIIGSVGSSLGTNMKSGSLKVSGNAQYSVGDLMHNGTIIIEGNAEDSIGEDMRNGSIIIKGNAGSYIGCGEKSKGMKNGSILIKGNAEDVIGTYMNGGTIFIEGDCGDEIGSFMRKGLIIINGNAGNKIGPYMEGGKIVINGTFNKKYICLSCKGEIYHKGKRVLRE